MNPHWLLPVDGSLAALRAVDHALGEVLGATTAPAISLVNVQRPLPSDITRFVSGTVVHDYHHDTGETALADARARLEDAGVAYSEHVLVGEAAPTISNFARENGCTLIIMGSRGLGTVSGILLGSVTSRVVHLTDLPVVVVK
ncbi:MAG: universal stress protein [Candidatus Accumulibacter sp.]|uniref:universal stress protein n=1 Tax=Accumulibacter sp. TaxID=2053492 RepID=UPI0019F5B940|nr:universal stress protein [Accumulibacter sp.]MBE2261029.1 universal stress protein [Paracoccaceae bacterium]MCB1941756.1 universal stress protein [Accumulibacter sp.]MCP5249238.1 universal stress protein [Accumulibacter sp.]